MLGLSSVLALFMLLAIASAMFFIARKIRIPYTILLVLVGLLIVPLANAPYLEQVFGFLDDLVLTPELLFYIFLPILIFESAFNMKVRKMVENIWTISLLAVVGLLVSTVLISVSLYFLLPFIGLEIPFIVALLFAAIISSTDPVAVLALFKDYGAPKRLSLIFEGESLFNDGTAVALFLVILAIADSGFHGTSTVIEGVLMFGGMVVFGIVLGLLLAGVFSKALRYTKSNEFVSMTLLIISAHIVFIISETVNENGLFGLTIHVSPIIATTVAALFLGNYARHILSPKMDDYLEKSIEHLAFVANSLVFLLAGILFASTNIDIQNLWLPVVLTVVVVALARVIAVYAVMRPLGILKLEAPIPPTWQRLLAWGSLRGALAIIIVLLIPENFMVDGWMYTYPPRDLILALTIGCILATLFIKGLTIGPMIRRLKLDTPNPIDVVHEADLGIYYLLTEQSRFDTLKTRGFVRDQEHALLKEKLSKKSEQAYDIRNQLVQTHGHKIFEQSLRMTAIDVEYRYLKQLYMNDELSERVYRNVKGKLVLQREKIEYAQHDNIDPSLYRDRKDVFDRLVVFIQTLFDKKNSQFTLEEKLQYYRAQMIIARKAVKTLDQMQYQYGQPVFIPEVYTKVVKTYTHFKTDAAEKMDKVLEKDPQALGSYISVLAERSLQSSGGRALDFLRDRGIVDESSEHSIERHYSL